MTQSIPNETADSLAQDSAARCPIDHSQWSHQKTARTAEPLAAPDIECDEPGLWHVRGFNEARAILRHSDTKQAGFNAELMEKVSSQMQNRPIIYQEGKEHQLQRKQTARFFTPKTVSSNYRQLMERLVNRQLKQLKRNKEADLSQLSLGLAVRVAAEVVGLTNSRLPGMAKRLEAFFDNDPTAFGKSPRAIMKLVLSQARVAAFFYLDVKPAIEARKRQPREDVISHLLAQGYNDAEILTECITYAAAGMITTREFISVAAWHFLERPELRDNYLAAPEDERFAQLAEVLRLEPVVGHLYRRATADLKISSGGKEYVIPQGALIDVSIHGANTDETVVGEQPLMLCPDRELKGERVPGELMGFGDGVHRCPGSYIAIQETDIFLQPLLSMDGLRIEQKPSVSWNKLVTGYEIRNFKIAVN